MSPAADLLSWYDAHGRELPWRRDRDPYRVWVSEVMLQQTRVETVLPYYERFLDRFPDVEALAAADAEELLALWSGLGYYRRARQMHAAARRVVEEHGGRFPDHLEGLRSLPGIGEYTAAAVGSIAFGLAEPVMDGNVERVVARLLALEGDPKRRPVRRRLLAAAGDLLDPARPGDGNQALMELGATVCTPRAPRCLLCPLREPLPGSDWPHAGEEGSGYPGCRAFHEGEPERYPPPRRRRRMERERRVVVVVERRGAVLLFRRPEDSHLLAGTWELPWVATADGDGEGASPADALARRYGGTWRLGERLGEVRHGITHRSIRATVRRGSVDAGGGGKGVEGAVVGEGGAGGEPGWFDAEAREGIPLSSLVTKALKLA